MKDIKILLGKRIKELRKKLNISQQELAEKINVDARNLSNIECGISFPSKTLGELAFALNVTLPELFDFEHLNLDRKDLKNEIIQNLKTLSDEDLKIIYKLTKAMK